MTRSTDKGQALYTFILVYFQSDVLMKIINTSLASQLQHQTPSEVKLEEADDQLRDDLEEV